MSNEETMEILADVVQELREIREVLEELVPEAVIPPYDAIIHWLRANIDEYTGFEGALDAKKICEDLIEAGLMNPYWSQARVKKELTARLWAIAVADHNKDNNLEFTTYTPGG